MSRSLTLELSEENYQAAVSNAEAAGKTLTEWMDASLTRFLTQEAPSRSFDSFSPEVQSAVRKLAVLHGGTPEQYAARFWNQIGPKPGPIGTEEELEAARQRLQQFSGCINGGSPNFADNDQIDADLAAEYASRHDEEA